jgi:hypothetical protein
MAMSGMIPFILFRESVDMHEGTSRDTCFGLYFVAVHINRFDLVYFVDFLRQNVLCRWV